MNTEHKFKNGSAETAVPVEIPPRTTSINPAQIELPDINTDTGDGDAGLAELATGDK